MIDVKQAAQIAANYFSDLNPGKFQNLALEEIELTDDEENWLVTLGYNPPSTNIFVNGPVAREYKVIRIDAKDGKVVSMKIKKI